MRDKTESGSSESKVPLAVAPFLHSKGNIRSRRNNSKVCNPLRQHPQKTSKANFSFMYTTRTN